MIGQALRGTPIVYSRKPDPNLLSVDARLNEEAWAAGIRQTLDAARGASWSSSSATCTRCMATSATRGGRWS